MVRRCFCIYSSVGRQGTVLCRLLSPPGSYLILVHVYPDSAGVGGIRAGIDPLDAVDTVVDVGINEVVQGLFVAALPGVHGDRESLVEVGPGVDEAGVVEGAQSLIFQSFGIEVIHGADQDLLGLALDLVAQLIGVHVVPLQGSLGADDADGLGGVVACVDSGCPYAAYGAALITHQAVGVVLEGITGADESLAVAEDLFELFIRADQLGHVVGVCGQGRPGRMHGRPSWDPHATSGLRP